MAYTIYKIVWAIIAIGIGGFGLFFTEKFIAGNVRHVEWLYNKTGIGLFKYQSERMARQSRIFIKVLGLTFVVLGILILLGKIS